MSDSYDTSATSPDPESVGEGDSDQLSAEDMLTDRGVEDLLDEGYIAPDDDEWDEVGPTPAEEVEGESLEQRTRAELPEQGGWSDPDRAGRIESADESADLYGREDGIAGGAASAEEAALHVADDAGAGYDTEDQDEGADERLRQPRDL